MSEKPTSGAAFNLMMEEETKESLIAMLFKSWREADSERAKVKALREAGEQARAALYLVLRGLRAGHVKAKAIVPREGPILSLEARIEPAYAAVSAALATTSDPIEAPSAEAAP